MTPPALGNVRRDTLAASRWQRRFAALLEVVGVFVGGTLLARLVSRELALGPTSIRALAAGVRPDFISLAWSTAANLILRYGFVLGLAFIVGWWHRRRHLSEYGVTAAARPFREHLGIALLLFATTAILPLLVKLLPNVVPMGRAPAHWALTESLSARGVWLYLFVGSFGLVPIVEELLARGYIQSRLAEDFGAPAAILITAVFFTFSHTQYFIASPIGIGMLASLLIGSVAAGYVRHRTASLLPGIIAHALGNLPFRGWFALALLGILVLVVAIWARTIYGYAVQLWRDVMTRDAFIAAVVGFAVLALVLTLIFVAPTFLPACATVALGTALMLEFREKRANQLPDSCGARPQS